MEGFLFALDMLLIILLLFMVDRAERMGKDRLDHGLFAYKREAGPRKGKGGRTHA